MSRVFGFLLHNWPLKLAAITLATILYAGLVLSQGARVWPGTVPVQVLNQPPSAFILNELPEITNIRYFAPTQSIERLSSAAFIASIDLAGAVINPADPFISVDVTLRPSDPAVQIIDFRPRRITVRLDPVVVRTVPVQVNHGVVPDGLEASPAELSQPTVEVNGPQSVIGQVVAAEARVRIQPSGIDVDQLVDLIAIDARGEQLTPLEIRPSSVRVRIEVSSDITTKTVPVTPAVTGVPGTGFALVAATAEPAVIAISGSADVLATVTSVATRPVAIDGATGDVTLVAELDLPGGVTAVGTTTVNVTITLRQREGTRSLAAGLILVGAEPDRTYSLGAESVIVTIGGTEQAVNAVAPGSFTAVVDVTDVAEGQQELPVRVTLPDGVALVSVSPPQVTVFVGPRATPPPTPSPTPSPTPVPTVTPTASPTPVPTVLPTEPAPTDALVTPEPATAEPSATPAETPVAASPSP